MSIQSQYKRAADTLKGLGFAALKPDVGHVLDLTLGRPFVRQFEVADGSRVDWPKTHVLLSVYLDPDFRLTHWKAARRFEVVYPGDPKNPAFASNILAVFRHSLGPKRFGPSPHFKAILAGLLHPLSPWTSSDFAGICVTSDGFFMGMRQGDVGYNEFLGPVSELVRNLKGAADALGFLQVEKDALVALAESKRHQHA